MAEIIGRVHSFQSLGAVDGPGLRYVIFLQGCPYSCPYCHNPDTKSFSGGEEYTVEEIVARVKRYRTYFGKDGGVTVSGGEPLMQSEFVAALFKRLHEEGIHTALDTAAVKPNAAVEEVLQDTDMVLCDIKYPTEEGSNTYFGHSLAHTLAFLELCNRMAVDIVLRHVVVPHFTDSEEDIRAVARIGASLTHLSKIELLPFQKMCLEKYEKLGLPFPMADTPECDVKTLAACKAYLEL